MHLNIVDDSAQSINLNYNCWSRTTWVWKPSNAGIPVFYLFKCTLMNSQVNFSELEKSLLITIRLMDFRNDFSNKIFYFQAKNLTEFHEATVLGRRLLQYRENPASTQSEGCSSLGNGKGKRSLKNSKQHLKVSRQMPLHQYKLGSFVTTIL